MWFQPLLPKGANSFAGDKAGQNAPADSVGLASLPGDPFTPFLLGAENIRVAGTEALPAGNRQSIKQAEWTYGLMMHMSKSLRQLHAVPQHALAGLLGEQLAAAHHGLAWHPHGAGAEPGVHGAADHHLPGQPPGAGG